MDKPNRIRQLYGYMVCLIAVVTLLISINGVVSNTIDLSDPLTASNGYGESLSSFDAWIAGRNRYPSPAGDASARDTASVETLKVRFAALQASSVARQTFQARKGLVSSSIVLLLAIVLFVSHWRWLRGLRDVASADSA